MLNQAFAMTAPISGAAMPEKKPASPGPLLQTNLNTDFLKLVAILSMLVDHIGGDLFPDAAWMRCVGRLAFPIFCYCLTVGLMYTKNIKKYLLRLAVFAVISQPFYILAGHPFSFWEEFTNWNIFFTLFLSLLAMYGFKEKKWWLFLLAFFVIAFWNFDYSTNGIIFMLIFYCCRNNPKLGALIFTATYLPNLFYGVDLSSPFTLMLGGFAFNGELCALLTVPLIFCKTGFSIKIPKWFFYGFYPAHLAVIGAVRLALGI